MFETNKTINSLTPGPVSESYGMEVRQLRRKQRGRGNEARNVAIYLGRTMGGYKLIELGQHLGELRYSSVSEIVYEVERSLSKDKQSRKRLVLIENHNLNRQS